MTTTANKAGMRKAAEGRRNKHAQRTPLPPRPGDVQDAKDVLQYGTMTQSQLLAKAQELGLQPPKSAPKGKLLNAIIAKERSAKTQEELEAAERAAGKPKTPKRRSTKGGIPAGFVRTEEPLSFEPKSLSKAQRLAEEISSQGWKTDIRSTPDAGGVEAVAKRGDEAMHIAWVGGVFVYESATYTYADRVTKIRNVSQARQMAARPAEEAAQVLQRVASNKAWKRKAPAEGSKRVVRLPFDPESATDREIVDAIVGKGIKWHNRLSGRDESAIAPADPRRIEVVEQLGERVLKFCCPATGYRALRVTALLAVGRGQRATRGQERAKGGTAIVEVKEDIK